MATANLHEALGAAAQLDPAAWVALHKAIPLAVAGGLVGAGLVLMLLGVERMVYRAFMAASGAGLAWLLAPSLAEWGSIKLPVALWGAVAVAVVAGLLIPTGLLFAVMGAGGAFMGWLIAGDADGWFGAVPGFLLGGALGIFFQRGITAMLTSIVGAAMLTLGAMTVLAQTRFAGVATGHAWADMAFAGALAVGGMVFQLKLLPTPEQRARSRAGKLRTSQLHRDSKLREQKLAAYDRKMGGG